MTPEQQHILVIDDHPIIRGAYTTALQHIQKQNLKFNFNIKEARDCDTAIHMLDHQSPLGGWHLILLDLSLPPSKDGKFLSGEDIGMYIREKYPRTKIIIVTTFDSSYRIQNIFKNINPEGFVIKSDSTASQLVKGIVDVLEDSLFYSKTVLQALRKNTHQDTRIDVWDRKILYELSKGTKTVDLPKTIPFSLATIERRKKRMKEELGTEGESDKELLEKAREMGFI